MATTLTDDAVYGIPYPITVTFADEVGTPFIPDTLSWTLTNSDGTIINSRQDVVIAVPAASVTITLGNDDILYADGSTRILTLSGTFNSNDIGDVVYFSIQPDSLIINNEDFNRIISCIGYPIVSPADLGVTNDQIKALFILPILMNSYFLYFPLSDFTSAQVTSDFSIAFPDIYTFGVTDARINTRPYTGSVRTANPIINDLIISPNSSRSQKMWGTENDYGFTQVKIMQRMEKDAAIQSEKAIKVRVNVEDRVLEGYSNVFGDLSITWAKFSRNFNDVKFQFKEDAIRLAQARIMEYFGLLREQAVNDLPTELDGSEFLSRAESYREEILEKWRAHTKVILLR